MIANKSCSKCRFLKKYTSEDGKSQMDVCEAEEQPGEERGLYYAAVIYTEDFDAADCLNFKASAEVTK